MVCRIGAQCELNNIACSFSRFAVLHTIMSYFPRFSAIASSFHFSMEEFPGFLFPHSAKWRREGLHCSYRCGSIRILVFEVPASIAFIFNLVSYCPLQSFHTAGCLEYVVGISCC